MWINSERKAWRHQRKRAQEKIISVRGKKNIYFQHMHKTSQSAVNKHKHWLQNADVTAHIFLYYFICAAFVFHQFGFYGERKAFLQWHKKKRDILALFLFCSARIHSNGADANQLRCIFKLERMQYFVWLQFVCYHNVSFVYFRYDWHCHYMLSMFSAHHSWYIQAMLK